MVYKAFAVDKVLLCSAPALVSGIMRQNITSKGEVRVHCQDCLDNNCNYFFLICAEKVSFQANKVWPWRRRWIAHQQS